MISRFAWIGLLLFVGCAESGRPVGDVFGKVTYKGAPVTEGLVSFYSKGANYGADAQINSDGSYRFKTAEGGMLPGDYDVTILPPTVLDSSNTNSPPIGVTKDMPNIPKKYRDAATSDLKATVKEGKNEHNFDLK